MKYYIRILVAVLATVLGLFVGFSTTANAGTQAANSNLVASSVDLNNLVCNKPDKTGRVGVYSKKKLLYYARGGKDPCGRTVNKIWAAMGITLQVAKTMSKGTICASDGWISSGHKHSPVPSKDVLHHAGGQRFYTRPLWVWGDLCYRGWVGWTEDGTEVGVLESCGNGEAMRLPPKHRHRHPHPKKANVFLQKDCVTGHQDAIECPSGTFQFIIGGKTVVYSPPPGSDEMYVGKCTVGHWVNAREVNIPTGWEIDPGTDPIQPAQKCKPGGIKFTFKNKETSTSPQASLVVSNVTQPQEVFTNESYPNFCATVHGTGIPAGDPIQVKFGARFGTGFTVTFSYPSSQPVCGTYMGPSDLPFVWTPPSWSGITTPDTWEQVHVVATDLNTGVTSYTGGSPPNDEQAWVWFPIRQ